MSDKKYLIINADDFGLNSDINTAILKGHLNGCLTSTSLIAVAPEKLFTEAIEILRSNRKLDFGIHIVLTSDIVSMYKPLSNEPAITCNGFFYRNPLQWSRILSKRKFKYYVEIEMRKQIEKVLKTGLVPSHLNSHYYVTDLPNLSGILIKLAKEYNIKAVRNPYEAKSFITTREFKLGKYIIVRMLRILSRYNRKIILQNEIMTSDYYYGIYYSGKMNKVRILNILEHLKPGISELLLHPSLENSSHFHEVDEYEALISDTVKKFIKENDIVLTCYRNLRDNC